MVFETKYFTPIEEDRKQETVSFIVRTIFLHYDTGPNIVDSLEGFLYEKTPTNPLENDRPSYLIRKLSELEWGDRNGRLPIKPEPKQTEDYEIVCSIT